VRLAAACILLFGCTRSSPDTITPAPERSIPPAPPPPPDLVFTDVRCQIGGTAPAFFVWAEASASRPVKELRAVKFELATKPSGFASGVGSTTIALRRREAARGQGDVRPLGGTIEPGAVVHLEIFGALSLAPFGDAATYPTEDRAFRAELQSASGRFVVEGTCVVGPAG
jgi:hypothetical protein